MRCYGVAWADCLLSAADCDCCLRVLAAAAGWAGGPSLPLSAAVPFELDDFCAAFCQRYHISQQQQPQIRLAARIIASGFFAALLPPCACFSREAKQSKPQTLTLYSATLPSSCFPQLRAGCGVVVLARSRAKYDKLLPILVEKKLPIDDLHFIAIDLSSTDDIRRAATEANDWAGGCADILVNNGKCTAHSSSLTFLRSVQQYMPSPACLPVLR